MRCKICDAVLSSTELKRLDVDGTHLDICNRCVGNIYETTEEYDFINDVNLVVDNEDEPL
jgi:ribosome-binding protein aMBF1 (putative translation factor)|tara:strand:+ start:2321 stop:2500 length:180 start_codon:yes stop_codon:yes gene_type:complete